MKKHYRFVSDPGHGWLGVPHKDLVELGISREISKYSYFEPTRGLVWLEEDCDASLFMDKARAAGWEVTLTDEVLNEKAFIRKLPRTA